ncbi:MAG: NAD/NADP octopine/nopaline dehydrogenase family protein [Lachnospiraceae bacterium]|nr:NAD/NADP octopine/nopaline dehydrogenase family protein [Lachnospiraceae bacterium]
MGKTWAIIGGGNGGQAMAGHLASMGQKVRLFDVVQKTVDTLNEKGGIHVHHAVEAYGPLEFATTDVGKAMEGADVIMMILPSIYHASMAKKMIPHLKDGQVVLLHPEESGGAMQFRKIMKDMDCAADVVVGGCSTLLYSTRIVETGDVYIFGRKDEVPTAALPSSDNPRMEAALHPELPWFKMVDSVLVTSIDNLNAMMHPAPMLLNTSRIEAEPFIPFQYYHEGITPSIGKYIEAMDRERIALAKAFGYHQRNIREEYVAMYECGTADMPLYQLVRNNPGYEGIMCANTLETRYLLEDIPYSLVAIRALAEVAGVETPAIDAMISLGYTILGDKLDEGRTKEALGIDGMDREALLRYVLGE